MSVDKPFDESIEVQDSEDILTPRQSKADHRMEDSEATRKKKKPGLSSGSHEDAESPAMPPSYVGGSKLGMTNMAHGNDRGGNHDPESTTSEDDDDEDEDEDDDDEEEENTPEVIEGAYNPADYEHLVVSPEIKEMFEYIQRYVPHLVELDTQLKPFIPDYIAAVGDIDAFIKIPRPDGKPDQLGLRVLDEPCANQSDPTVLDLQLRALSKQTTSKQVVVRSIKNPERNPKAVENWIKNISDLYRAKPPPTVHYTRNMPEISTLMAEWPIKFEDKLRKLQLPSSELDCSLTDYVDIVCALLDIPVYRSRIHALHLLFSLYLEFKNSQHFQPRELSNPVDQ